VETLSLGVIGWGLAHRRQQPSAAKPGLYVEPAAAQALAFVSNRWRHFHSPSASRTVRTRALRGGSPSEGDR
jgi:hypothetical protein